MENGSADVINTVGFNHNGQLVVTGDVGGMIKVYGNAGRNDVVAEGYLVVIVDLMRLDLGWSSSS